MALFGGLPILTMCVRSRPQTINFTKYFQAKTARKSQKSPAGAGLAKEQIERLLDASKWLSTNLRRHGKEQECY
jgi:hypothetical protein